MSRFSIRSAGADDVDVISEFNLRLAEESEGLELDPATSREGVAAVLRDPNLGFYLLAESGKRTVGQLQITFEWSNWRNAFFWWIQSVYVAPEVRGRGVFRMLYRHVLKMAKSRGNVRGLRLYVHEENRAAIDVYLHLGMKHPGYRMLEVDFAEAE